MKGEDIRTLALVCPVCHQHGLFLSTRPAGPVQIISVTPEFFSIRSAERILGQMLAYRKLSRETACALLEHLKANHPHLENGDHRFNVGAHFVRVLLDLGFHSQVILEHLRSADPRRSNLQIALLIEDCLAEKRPRIITPTDLGEYALRALL